MATTKQQPMTREGQGGGNRLIFPNHLAELINQDIGHPFLMLLNNEDSSEICLPIPDAISLADGANYEGLDKTDFKSAEKFAEGAKLTPADQLALGLRVTPLCITPHKSIIKVSYFLNISARWFSSFNVIILPF